MWKRDELAKLAENSRGEFVDMGKVNTLSRFVSPFLSRRRGDVPFLLGRFPSPRRDFNWPSLNDRSPASPLAESAVVKPKRCAGTWMRSAAVTYRQVAAENCIVTPFLLSHSSSPTTSFSAFVFVGYAVPRMCARRFFARTQPTDDLLLCARIDLIRGRSGKTRDSKINLILKSINR